ncbi:MAG: hypothetical protein QXM31_03770 [Candidatus Woesearchaeota archaeon]
MDKKGKITINIKILNIYLIIGLVIVLLMLGYKAYFTKPAETPAEPTKLSQLTVTVITPPKCDDCFEKEAFAAAISQLPKVNVTEEYLEYNSTEGKKLIEEYNLTRLPAAIITGDTEAVNIPNFPKKGSAYYFTETPPPYYDIKQKKVIGRVAVTYITHALCPQCFNIAVYGTQLKDAGIDVTSERTLDATSADAMAMISRYGITKLPTMLMSPDAMEYEIIRQAWPAVGSQHTDGMLILRNVTPPYYDLGDNKVHGLVTITYVADKTCAECYNVSLHRALLEQGFGVHFAGEKSIDVSSLAGKDILRKYNITLVPTVLLDKEAQAYAAVMAAWSEVGSVEPDGMLVFRRVDLLSSITYKDLATGNVSASTAG